MDESIAKGPSKIPKTVIPFGIQLLEEREPISRVPVENWDWNPEKEIGDLVVSRNTTEMSGPNSGEDRDEIGW